VGDVDRVATEHLADDVHRLRRMDPRTSPLRDGGAAGLAPLRLGPRVVRELASGTWRPELAKRACETGRGAREVGDDRHRHRTCDADRAGIGVDLDELLTRRIAPVLVV